MRKHPGLIRLQALPAPDVWHARNAMSLYAVEPVSTVTVTLHAGGLKTGDVAGLAFLRRPHAWLGVERHAGGFTLAQFDEPSGATSRVALGAERVWLRAECDLVRNATAFCYSIDGKRFIGAGEPYRVPNGASPRTQGLTCSLFSFTRKSRAGGYAEFEAFILAASRPRP
jgi:xylan 1,4-beta-xylosidase